MVENLMDIKQVAEYLQMNKMTVYKLAREGKVPAFKVASEWRFRKDLIDKWLVGQLKGRPEMEGISIEAKLDSGSTILVVDDSPTDLRLMTSPLQEEGYRVITAQDGEEALELAMQEMPNLIVLDVVLPKKNGFQVCRQLKASPETQKIKILMLTSKSQDSDRFWGLKQGADKYMTKPFDDNELAVNVAKLLAANSWEL